MRTTRGQFAATNTHEFCRGARFICRLLGRVGLWNSRISNAPGQACHGWTATFRLTLAEVGQHGLYVAGKPLGVCLAGFTNFGKHGIKFHRESSRSSSGVQITGIS